MNLVIYRTKKISQQDLESLASITAYIDKHLAFELPLEVLAKLACMGTTKLKYTFKEVYKSTISEYILKKRMFHAENLLTNTDLNIKEIAQIIGYKKASSFAKTFRENVGLLPTEYRKLTVRNSK